MIKMKSKLVKSPHKITWSQQKRISVEYKPHKMTWVITTTIEIKSKLIKSPDKITWSQQPRLKSNKIDIGYKST